MACSNCGKTDHNAATCDQPCGKCSQHGHKKKQCPVGRPVVIHHLPSNVPGSNFHPTAALLQQVSSDPVVHTAPTTPPPSRNLNKGKASVGGSEGETGGTEGNEDSEKRGPFPSVDEAQENGKLIYVMQNPDSLHSHFFKVGQCDILSNRLKTAKTFSPFIRVVFQTEHPVKFSDKNLHAWLERKHPGSQLFSSEWFFLPLEDIKTAIQEYSDHTGNLPSEEGERPKVARESSVLADFLASKASSSTTVNKTLSKAHNARLRKHIASHCQGNIDEFLRRVLGFYKQSLDILKKQTYLRGYCEENFVGTMQSHIVDPALEYIRQIEVGPIPPPEF